MLRREGSYCSGIEFVRCESEERSAPHGDRHSTEHRQTGGARTHSRHTGQRRDPPLLHTGTARGPLSLLSTPPSARAVRGARGFSKTARKRCVSMRLDRVRRNDCDRIALCSGLFFCPSVPLGSALGRRTHPPGRRWATGRRISGGLVRARRPAVPAASTDASWTEKCALSSTATLFSAALFRPVGRISSVGGARRRRHLVCPADFSIDAARKLRLGVTQRVRFSSGTCKRGDAKKNKWKARRRDDTDPRGQPAFKRVSLNGLPFSEKPRAGKNANSNRIERSPYP